MPVYWELKTRMAAVCFSLIDENPLQDCHTAHWRLSLTPVISTLLIPLAPLSSWMLELGIFQFDPSQG